MDFPNGTSKSLWKIKTISEDIWYGLRMFGIMFAVFAVILGPGLAAAAFKYPSITYNKVIGIFAAFYYLLGISWLIGFLERDK